jgi:hypothetical protein
MFKLNNSILKVVCLVIYFSLASCSQNEQISQKDLPKKLVTSIPQKNLIDLQEEKFQKWLPSNQKRQEIWTYIFSKKKDLKICELKSLDPNSLELFQRKFEENTNRRLNIFSVGKNQYFVEVLCFWANYQGSFEFFLYSEIDNKASLKRLLIRQFYKEDGDKAVKEINSTSVAALSRFNPIDKTLELISKSRGAGGCGTMGNYKFKEDRLELLIFRAQWECVRKKDYDADQYPIIYP